MSRAILGQQRSRLILASTLFVGHQAGEAMVPVVAGVVIDRAVLTSDRGALVLWLAVLAATFAILSTSWRWGDRTLTTAAEDAAHRLRMDITRHVLHDGALARRPASGEVVGLATGDAAGATRILLAVAFGVAAVAALAIAAAILLTVSVMVGLVVLVGLPIVVLAISRITRPLEQRTDRQRAESTRAAAVAVDLLRGLRITKGLRAEQAATDRYRAVSRSSLAAGLQASRYAAVHEGSTVLVTGLFVAVVALIAGREAAQGDVTVGQLVAAVGVTQFLIAPLWRLGFALAETARARACAARIADLLDTPRQVITGDGEPRPGGGAVRFSEVSHGTLNRLDLAIPAAGFVAISADDPADAEAIVELLARRADPSSGTVELNGVPLPELRLDLLRAALVVAPHDAALFDGSVAENILPNASNPGHLLALVDAAGASDLIHTLPGGLDSQVGNRGERLSGGQRQRVAIARALATEAPVLVLHDPTTSIDPFTEHAVARGVHSWREGRTTVVVTSSAALLAVADEVVVVRGGRVAGRCTHADLVSSDYGYAGTVAP